MSEAYLLSATWVLPLFTALLLILTPPGKALWPRRISLISALLNMGLLIYLSIRFIAISNPEAFDPTSKITTLHFSQKVEWFPPLHIQYFVGIDGISLLMMLLAGIIVLCGVLVSWNITERSKEFFIYLQILIAGVFGSFISFDLFTFFLFNEITLIPTYLLIGIFGSGRKEYAAMKLNLMLLAASALIFAGLFGLYYESGLQSWNILELAQVKYNITFQYWGFPTLFLGFGILGAIFPFHTWSPDGHSSAPTAISMFLAGVHMKLGGYGCIRIAMYLLPEGAHIWMDVFLILATLNVVYGAFVALKQTDLKYLNAFSSVSHCGLVLFGFAALTSLSLQGAVMQMVAHGLLTSLFFCLIGMIYQRTHTRQIPAMGGLMKTIPFIGVAFIITGLAGLGLPGLGGFAAEFTLFLGAFGNAHPLYRICTALCVLSIIVTAVYILRGINGILNGPPHGHSEGFTDAVWVEKIPVLILLFCIVAMGIYPGWISHIVEQAIQPILQNLQR